MSVIEVSGLVRHYGSVFAVDGVDLTVEEGEFFGILGPNGAGKTTLLELVEGLREPMAGRISVFGLSPWPRNPALLPRLGVQLQASAFFEQLTAREQLQTFADLYGAGRSRVDQMLEEVGLTEHAGQRTEKLSGGQMQRLSIACALVHDPELVFLDEPTAALDPQARRNLWDLLRSINASGRSVVLTTHYMDEAEQLCDRVAIMDTGKILTVDTPANMVRALDAPTRVSLPEQAVDRATATALVGPEAAVVDNGTLTLTTHEPARVIGELAARHSLEGLQVRGGTLEDVFLSLTGREYRE
ncbi:MAG: ABC transporter ATP-binding protein [Dermatophilaceae bacterium]